MQLIFKKTAIEKLACLSLSLLALLMMQGCRSAASATEPGTPGILTLADQPCADFEVRVYRAGQSAPLGVGLTGLDGRFGLINPDGAGPCWLTPGEYKVSIESIGPGALELPSTYSDPQNTPLNITWKAEDSQLTIALPAIE